MPELSPEAFEKMRKFARECYVELKRQVDWTDDDEGECLALNGELRDLIKFAYELGNRFSTDPDAEAIRDKILDLSNREVFSADDFGKKDIWLLLRGITTPQEEQPRPTM